MAANYLRQAGLLHRGRVEATSILMIGAGGIGSSTAVILAKMGFPKLEIWDADILEDHNFPNQFYPIKDTGKAKVDALKSFIKTLVGSDTKVTANNALFETGAECNADIVISAVDNMAARSTIWNAFKNSDSADLFIDARMGGLHFEIYTVRAGNEDDYIKYEASLFADDMASPIPCTEKAISFNTMSIGSFIGSIIRRKIDRQSFPTKLVVDLNNFEMIVSQ